MREQLLTAVNRTANGVEWTALRKKQSGFEIVHQDAMKLELPDDAPAASLPKELLEKLKGEVVIPIRSSQLLLCVMDLPAADDSEISGMVEFQMDKISPFPSDQLAISHEILNRTEVASTVLMAGVQRSRIDTVGDEFKELGINIHGMDARCLGWLELLRTHKHLPEEPSVLLIDDGIDFTLVVTTRGIPVGFRALEHLSDAEFIENLAYEIEYTLTTLETGFDEVSASSIHYWSYADLSATRRQELANACELSVVAGNLKSLPPLSEGIAARACTLGSKRIELIPREWIEHEKHLKLKKRFTVSIISLLVIWAVVLGGLFGVFKHREMQLQEVHSRAKQIEAPAKAALENRDKVKTLKKYSDRSASALECLREVTRLLPAGDIEFSSYKYSKNKELSLRGTASSSDLVYDFTDKLGSSSLFTQLKNQSNRRQTVKGVSREVFSVTLVMANEEDSK